MVPSAMDITSLMHGGSSSGGSSGNSGIGAAYTPDCPDQCAQFLHWWQMAIAAAAVLINAGISMRLRLGLHWVVGLAAVRCGAQLTVLGYLLLPILHFDAWWLVLLYSGVMMLVAALEATSRPGYSYQGLLVHTLASLSAGSTLMILYASLAALQLRPLLSAQYIVPLLGVLLGAAISSVSAGVTAALETVAGGRDEIECMLALGADRMEATRWVVHRAWAAALTPLLHQLSVAGLVAVPPMMAGQVLEGADPIQAARYQIVMLFLASGACGIGALVAIQLAVYHLVDNRHCLRLDRLAVRCHQTGIALYLRAHGRRALTRSQHALLRLLRRPRWNSGSGGATSEHRRSLMVGELSGGRAVGAPSGLRRTSNGVPLPPPQLRLGGSGRGAARVAAPATAGMAIPQPTGIRKYLGSRQPQYSRVPVAVEDLEEGAGSYFHSPEAPLSGDEMCDDLESVSGTYTSHQGDILEYEAARSVVSSPPAVLLPQPPAALRR